MLRWPRPDIWLRGYAFWLCRGLIPGSSDLQRCANGAAGGSRGFLRLRGSIVQTAAVSAKEAATAKEAVLAAVCAFKGFGCLALKNSSPS